MTWSGLAYCRVPSITFLVDGSRPAGTLLAASAYVGHVDGQIVTLTEFSSCLPDHYCGATLIDAVVTFAPGARLPAYGELVEVYGVTAATGFTVSGSELLAPCEYALGCA